MLPSWLPPSYWAELPGAAKQPEHPRNKDSNHSDYGTRGLEDGRHLLRSRRVCSLEDLHSPLLVLPIGAWSSENGWPYLQPSESCLHRGCRARQQAGLLYRLILKTHGIALSPVPSPTLPSWGPLESINCSVFLQSVYLSCLLESHSFVYIY